MVVEVDRPQRTARLTPVAHVLAGLNGRGQADISLKLATMARLIAIRTPGEAQPTKIFEGHEGPVVDLSLSPDGSTLASASWDHTARLWPLAGAAPRLIEGHAQNVNGVAFAPDGRALVTAGYDATLRISPLAGGAPVV